MTAYKAPCQHGRYERHHIIADHADHIAAQFVPCPGGVFLADDTLVIEKVDGKWPEWVHEKAREMNRGYTAMTSGRFSIPVTTVLDALSVREAE